MIKKTVLFSLKLKCYSHTTNITKQKCRNNEVSQNSQCLSLVGQIDRPSPNLHHWLIQTHMVHLKLHTV